MNEAITRVIALIVCNCSGLLATCGGSLGFLRDVKVGGPGAANLHIPQKTLCEAPQALRSQKERT